MSQVDALHKTLELQESAQRKGHYALFNCLVLGHTKYKGVQWIYCKAMVAGCGSSTRGNRDVLVTCNKSNGIAARESAGRKVPCEHDASPCLGHATVCSGCPLTILLGSLGSASAR